MDILEILNAEKGLLLDMLSTLKAEKDALINDDIDKLQKAVNVKEDLSFRIDEIEKARIEKCDEMKLKDVILLFEGDERKQAEDIGREIEAAVYKIQQINDINKRLVTKSINYVRTIKNVLTPPKVKVYNSGGIVDNNSSSGRMVDRNI